MRINRKEQNIIQNILSLSTQVKSLDRFLQDFSKGIADLIECDYHGIVILPHKPLSNRYQFFTNNPSNFDDTYQQEFIDRDILLEILLNNPRRIHSYLLQNKDNEILGKFQKEVKEIRPAEDFCYTPINHNNSIIGFLGHARGEKDNRLITEKELNLINMMLPVLHAGVEYFSLKDQLCLQEMDRDECPLLASIMISSFGELDILYDDSSEVFREILNIPELTPELIMENSHVKRVYNALIHNTSQETGKAVIHHDGKKYILKLLIRKGNDNPISLGSIVISLTKDVSQYNYSDFSHRYGLTKREEILINEIFQSIANNNTVESFLADFMKISHSLFNLRPMDVSFLITALPKEPSPLIIILLIIQRHILTG